MRNKTKKNKHKKRDNEKNKTLNKTLKQTLNQTNNKQVRPILSSVFELIPTPISIIGCDPERLAAVIKTTGFQNVKASRIIKLSQKWVEGFRDAIELPGIGKYGRDSWEIFINGNLNIEVADKKLDAYLKAINRPSN